MVLYENGQLIAVVVAYDPKSRCGLLRCGHSVTPSAPSLSRRVPFYTQLISFKSSTISAKISRSTADKSPKENQRRPDAFMSRLVRRKRMA